MASGNSALPSTMKALVHEGKGDILTLKDVPTPQPTPGSVVVRVLAALADANIPRILSGEVSFFTFPIPFVPGTRSVGRVASIGSDTTSLEVGQLVLIEPFFRARDNPNLQILWGAFDGPTPASKKWTADNWRDASYAEYAKAPLENVWPLNEEKLCVKLGYSIPELVQLAVDAVAYGGLRGIDVKAGERLIVTPATGMFSGATVGIAVGMGASVIAVGRDKKTLQPLKDTYPDSVEIVQLTGDLEVDKKAMMAFGPVDVMLEMSPGSAAKSTYAKAALGALKQYGRASIMGVLPKDVEVSYFDLVFRNLTIKGQYMYEREDVRAMIKMAESGVMKLGKERGEVVGEFRLADFEKAFAAASKNPGVGKLVVLTP
ncbi:GroES-like protein [Zopfia rhizophila CBS 207.26]|uniref:GroES-like protein n=1 Tax=Zopfia rhizophila CBS 207.26 TaxID=1314779 RepID=A0A6A6EVX8_9PEZI|nr:GroES-like protein [Zopfia rhizophila CBS 207.26]